MELVNETVKLLFQQYNCGKTDAKNFMVHCRTSVEKYIFSHLYPRLNSMYKIKNQAFDAEYRAKKEVAKGYTIKRLLGKIKMSGDYFPIINEIEEHKVPYESAIQMLNCLEDENTPREKLKSIMNMDTELRICVMEYTKGQLEIGTTETLSKLLVYLLANTTLTSPAAELNFLRDYLLYQEPKLAAEEYLLTNLQASLIYFVQILNID
eukprot:TRINITY_DN17961_c0_g1_i1.p1 TRINITY_DN17961_c0_g1~~TRINITY_DN17961_c0_g1_i1.p1  ORF type:complete len:208 (+),score=25.39 TRINITY_DN17961_c0_g1_i1:311-934(+)